MRAHPHCRNVSAAGRCRKCACPLAHSNHLERTFVDKEVINVYRLSLIFLVDKGYPKQRTSLSTSLLHSPRCLSVSPSYISTYKFIDFVCVFRLGRVRGVFFLSI